MYSAAVGSGTQGLGPSRLPKKHPQLGIAMRSAAGPRGPNITAREPPTLGEPPPVLAAVCSGHQCGAFDANWYAWLPSASFAVRRSAVIRGARK